MFSQRFPPEAFGLQRGGSITSLDLDRTYWIRVKLLHFVRHRWFEGENVGKTWGKPGENWRKPGENLAKTEGKLTET